MQKWVLICLLVISVNAVAQPTFVPNIGQWNESFDYKLEYNSGALFFERNAVTFSFLNRKDLHELHDYELHNRDQSQPLKETFFENMPAVNGHAYKVVFEGARTEQIIPGEKKHTYHNYFLGNDRSRWKGGVLLYANLTYKGLYDGVNLKYYQQNGQLKYDLIVAPKADAGQIKLRYEGIKPRLDDGKILLDIGFETVTELAPYCYQVINGKKTGVASHYILEDGMLGFSFPEGYNKNYSLIIDPAILFRSYGGSTAYTTGYTNAHDNNGRLCVTGRVLGQGLPTTPGAFQMNFTGNVTAGDAAISVYNIDGTQQDYVTYLGGSNWEEPGPVRFNNNNELVLLMNPTNSIDFPVTPGCFDNVPPTGGNGGSKGAICVFSGNGAQLLGSTFFGGSANASDLDLDQNQNIIVAGKANQLPYAFPANAYQPLPLGNADNFLAKLNPALTQMIAGTFFGTAGTDLLIDIAYNKATNEILAAALAFGQNIVPATPGAFSNTGDNNIFRFNNDLTQLLAVAQHIQTSQLDCDGFGNIYIMGKGDPAISPNVYSHATGEGYVKKISADLNTELLSTQIGGAFINSPINMQVSACGYVCLYSVLDMPPIIIGPPPVTDADFTANAFQVAPQGSYYYEVLEPDFAGHPFATMLGSSEMDHVHSLAKNATGKTSMQYWGTCTESANWWQTPGAAQPVGPGPGNFDMAGIKFDVELPLGESGGAAISILPNDSLCLGDTLFLAGNSSPTATINWDFGDGTQSTVGNPRHTYSTPGIYHISYVSLDPNGCVTEVRDSATIYVFRPEEISVTPDTVVCDAQLPLEIKVTGGLSFLWSPETAVDNPTAPVVHLNNDGTYQLVVTVKHAGGCVTTHTVNVTQYNVHADAGPDHVIVPGKSVTLDGSASRGSSVYWDSSPEITYVNDPTPTFMPPATKWYYINAKDGETCSARDSALVTVVGLGLPNAFSPNGDGLNDVFKLLTNSEDNVKATIQVFNRFGERVFYSINVKEGWDGAFKGKPCDVGVYYYSIAAYIGDTEYYFKGDVSLIR